MASVELATAYISLVPSTRDLAKGVRKELGVVERDASRSGDRAGKGLGANLGRALGKTAKGAGLLLGGGIVAAAGTALVKGFGRLKSIDVAKSQLRGLKLEGKEIEGVMKSATAAVTGTAYGLDAAASAASGALGADVKQGDELTKYLTLVADATTQSTTDFNSMALMLNKVQGRGKLTGDVLNQMAENGLQVMPMLTKAYGKNAGEIQKMVSESKISAEDFKRILHENIGGAAQQSGSTFSGALDNMLAALGRVGAKFLDPVFEKMPGYFSDLGGALDTLGPYAETAGQKLGDLVSAGIDTIGPYAKTAAEGFKELAGVGWGKITKGVESLKGLKDIDLAELDGKKLGKQLAGVITDAIGAMGDLAKTLTSKIGDVLGKVDFVKLGIDLGKFAIPLLLGLATGLLNGVAEPGLWKGIWDNLPEIFMAAIGLVLAPAKLLSPLIKILSKIPFVGSLLAAIPKWLNKVGGPLRGFIGTLGKTFWEGFVTVLKASPTGRIAGAIMGVIRAIPARLKSAWETLKTHVGVSALDAFRAMGTGAGRAFLWVIKKVGEWPGTVLSTLVGLGTLLTQTGRDIVQGLWDGMKEKWEAVKEWFKGLGDFVPDWVTDAGGWVGDKLGFGGDDDDGSSSRQPAAPAPFVLASPLSMTGGGGASIVINGDVRPADSREFHADMQRRQRKNTVGGVGR